MSVTKRLQEIKSQTHKEQTVISVHFFKKLIPTINPKRKQERKHFDAFSSEISLPKVFDKCLLTQESLPKTLHLSLFTLKVISFGYQDSLS